MIKAIRSADEAGRYRLIGILGGLYRPGDSATGAFLCQTIESDAPDHLRVTAMASATGDIPVKEAAPILFKIARDPKASKWLRNIALARLGVFGAEFASEIDSMRGLAAHEEYRGAAVCGLGGIGRNDKNTAEYLLGLLKDEKETAHVRTAAADGLGKSAFGDIATQTILDLLREHRPGTGIQSQSWELALRTLGSRPPDEKTIPLLIAAMRQDTSSGLQGRLLFALGNAGNAARPYLDLILKTALRDQPIAEFFENDLIRACQKIVGEPFLEAELTRFSRSTSEEHLQVRVAHLIEQLRPNTDP